MKKISTLVLLILLGLSLESIAQDNKKDSRGLSIGQKAPNFKVQDQNGEILELNKVLEKSPVVLFFYRGAWCPYCNKQLKKLQASMDLITNKGATVIAITPSSKEDIKEMLKNTGAKFHIAHDSDGKIMNAYDLEFTLDQKTQKKYLSYGINLKKINAENGNNLPIPATYIINKKGKIIYSFINPDYTKRASVEEIVKHLP